MMVRSKLCRDVMVKMNECKKEVFVGDLFLLFMG